MKAMKEGKALHAVPGQADQSLTTGGVGAQAETNAHRKPGSLRSQLLSAQEALLVRTVKRAGFKSCF